MLPEMASQAPRPGPSRNASAAQSSGTVNTPTSAKTSIMAGTGAAPAIPGQAV